MMGLTDSKIIRFGVFEADLAARELRKRGVRVKLQEQPFRLLQTLLERPGEIVTREEIQQQLWPDDTFVDFDKSLNTAAQKLRQALGDSADSPRFLETIPRQGYRWLAPVESPTPVAPDPVPAATPRPLRRKFNWQRFTTGAVVLGAVGLVSLGYWLGRSEPPATDRAVTKFTLSPEVDEATPGLSEIVPSPDGRYIAFQRGPGPYGARLNPIVVWDAQQDSYRTVGKGGMLFWSPDSRQLGAVLRDRVQIIDLDSAAARTLASMPSQPERTSWGVGGTWSPDGESIVVSGGLEKGLHRIDLSGGDPELILVPPPEEAALHYYRPSFLPTIGGRKALLFSAGTYRDSEIRVLNLRNGQQKTIVPGGRIRSRAAYSPTGHVIYEQRTYDQGRNGIWAVPFSLDRLEATGEPFLISHTASYPGVTAGGILTYGKPQPRETSQLRWRDRNGNPLGTIGEPQEHIAIPVLSPNGDEVVVQGETDGVQEVWIHEVNRPVKRRVTFRGGARPTWLPSGSEVSFNRDGDLWVAAADGSAEPRMLFQRPTSRYGNFGFEWSRNGRYLVGSGGSFIFYLRPKADGEGWERVVFEDNSYDRVGPDLSPDGRYIAYESAESGRPEVYVRPFPEGDWKKQISTSGGGKPRWRSPGEVLYVEDESLMAVQVSTAPEFSAGSPQRLFTEEGLFAGRGQTYDVTPDGQRIVVVEGRQTPWPREIQVVQNWFEEFRDRDE